jgi:hypothetical protein
MGAPEPRVQVRSPRGPASQAKGQGAGTEGRPPVGGAPARAEATTFRRFAEALLTLTPYSPRGSCEKIVVEGGVARWLLGSSLVVTARRSLSGRSLITQFEDPRDNRRVVRRFNIVLRYLRDVLGIEYGVEYRVVNVLSSDSLDHLVYVRVGGRKFRGGRLTIVADLESRRAEVFINEEEEIVLFYGKPEYEELGKWIREALKTWENGRKELSALVARLRGTRVPPEYELRLRELLRKYDTLDTKCWRVTLGLLRHGSWVYGARVKYLDKIRKFPKWVAELMALRRELEEIATGGQK